MNEFHAISFRYLIMNAAPKWRQLEILPVTILFNLYEFIRVLTNFSEYYEKNTEDRPLEGIRSFTFKWQLHLHERGNQNAKVKFWSFLLCAIFTLIWWAHWLITCWFHLLVDLVNLLLFLLTITIFDPLKLNYTFIIWMQDEKLHLFE